MKKIIKLFTKHLISILSFAAIAWLWVYIIIISIQFENDSKHISHAERLVKSEGIGYGFYFAFILTIAFVIAMLINAAIRQEKRFYYGIILLIVIPLLLYANIYLLLLTPFAYFLIKPETVKQQ